MWSGTVVLISVLAVSSAIPAIKHSDQEGCYIPDLKKVVPVGKAVPAVDRCVEYRCRDKSSFTMKGCGSFMALPPLKIVEEKDKPFPGCCPYAVKST